MINLRYHIVSLVAVFLALAIGVIAGTTVIDNQLVDQLKKQDSQLRNLVDSQQAQNDELRRELQLWRSFGDILVPSMVRDQLRGKNVLAVTARDTDPALFNAIERTLTEAGASIAGRIAFTGRWQLGDPSVRQQLATALSSQATDPNDLQAEAATKIGTRLGEPGDPSDAGDLLNELQRAGFLSIDARKSRSFPARNSMVIVIASDAAEPIPNVDLALTLVRQLAPNMPTAVIEPLVVTVSVVERVRGDGALSRQVATVDDGDTAAGRLGLVEGLREVGDGRPAPHFGVRRGADAVIPTPTP